MPLGRFGVPFCRPLDFEKVPKVIGLQTNLHNMSKVESKKRSNKYYLMMLKKLFRIIHVAIQEV